MWKNPRRPTWLAPLAAPDAFIRSLVRFFAPCFRKKLPAPLHRLSCNSSGCLRKVPRNCLLSASSLFVILFLHPHYTYFFGLRHKCRSLLKMPFSHFQLMLARTPPLMYAPPSPLTKLNTPVPALEALNALKP